MVPKNSIFQKEKSRGKGKDKQAQGRPPKKRHAPICGTTGHRKRDSWYNEANLKPKEKGKDGKGKSSAGVQQQSVKDKKGVKCWNCNAHGHVLKDCPK